MKRDFKRCMALLGSHLMSIIICLLVLFPIVTLINSDLLLSVVMILTYLSAIYNNGWSEGFRDSKNVGDTVPDIPRAVRVVLMSSVVPVILLICRVVAYQLCAGGEKTAFLLTTDIIYRIYNFYFTQNMSSGSLLVYIIPILIPIIVYPIGYAVGLKRFSFSEKYLSKLIYKQKQKRNR